MVKNCRYGWMPGTNVSGIREGEEDRDLESKGRVKHGVAPRCVCPCPLVAPAGL